jgi:hypothetical protein
MKSAVCIGADAHHEIATLGDRIGEIVNDPLGAFVFRGVTFPGEIPPQRIDHHPGHVVRFLLPGHDALGRVVIAIVYGASTTFNKPGSLA